MKKIFALFLALIIINGVGVVMANENITLTYGDFYNVKDCLIVSQKVSSEGEGLGDTAVIEYQADSGRIKAVGLGSAVCKSLGKEYTVTVEKAPIALVMVNGQSNAAGDSSDYKLSPCAKGKYEGKFFVTNSMNSSADIINTTFENARLTAIDGGRSPKASGVWLNWSAAEACALGAKLSDLWNMKVWVVNCAICAQIIERFNPTEANHDSYTRSVYYMKYARKAIEDDKHYILDESKLGYFWLQGESNGFDRKNTENTMDQYMDAFMNMHNGFKQDLGIKYCGIWLVRGGVYSNNNKDFSMSGPRLAQIYMSNSNEDNYKDIYLILNTDIFKKDDSTKKYFEEKYSNEADFKEEFGYDMPKTSLEVKPSLHYAQKGYNELGNEAAVNINKIFKGDTKIKEAVLYDFDGNEIDKTAGLIFDLNKNQSEKYTVPMPKSIDFNAGQMLTLEAEDPSVISVDNEYFVCRAEKQGMTRLYVKCGNDIVASYKVMVLNKQPITIKGFKDFTQPVDLPFKGFINSR
ncbi:MAG: sialate O-acetylesterase [Bacillota bacterium]|nr:sialate O-acetylesterase [Bacillota bacterium]